MKKCTNLENKHLYLGNVFLLTLKFKTIKQKIMKKLLLISILIFTTAINANAQSCTPGANYADSTFGAWPDTIQNFPPAEQDVLYTTDLNFKVPTDAGDVEPALTGSEIESFTVNSVTGLPVGMTYSCNIATCEYLGGDNGCAQITGTCNTTGVYDITIDVTAIIIIWGSPVESPYTFTGYKIVVGTAGNIEAIINPITIHPNPANDKITLSGLNEQMKISSVTITNMEGKVMKNITVTSATMDVSLDGFESGVYFVEVNHAGGKDTLKFIKD